MKLCKDCKHYNFIHIGWCEHPRVGISPVDGKPIAMRCSRMREHGSLCAIEAKLFKPKTSFFIRIKNSLLNL